MPRHLNGLLSERISDRPLIESPSSIRTLSLLGRVRAQRAVHCARPIPSAFAISDGPMPLSAKTNRHPTPSSHQNKPHERRMAGLAQSPSHRGVDFPRFGTLAVPLSHALNQYGDFELKQQRRAARRHAVVDSRHRVSSPPAESLADLPCPARNEAHVATAFVSLNGHMKIRR
jgi:hypothetical protein